MSVIPCRRAARDERLLGAVQQPVRGEEPALLARVGVAEHDLLDVAAVPEMGAIAGVGEQPVEELVRAAERVRGLEQRDDVEHRLRGGQVGEDRHRAPERLRLRRAPGELEHGHDVVG